MKTEETTLDKIRTRPRFKMFTHLTKEEYAENLKKYLKEHKDTIQKICFYENGILNAYRFEQEQVKMKEENDALRRENILLQKNKMGFQF